MTEMNVRFGRYKKIPEETKDYCKGLYGRSPGEIKPEIMEIIKRHHPSQISETNPLH